MTQRTGFPQADTTRLMLARAGALDLHVRVPLASIFYGPVLLAAQEPGPREDWRPVTLDTEDLGKSITGNPAALRFSIGDVEFKPFYESYGRHSVYLDVTLK